LTFTALLRLPSEMELAAKHEIVDKTIRALGLQKCQNSEIGNVFRRGISGGERKRVNIGIELLNNPSVLLLDEPTSGLDSHIALSSMKLLRKFSQEGRTVICSIHQPSSQIFAAVS
jgi:ABC-type multidrug transport system ATPase subunit